MANDTESAVPEPPQGRAEAGSEGEGAPAGCHSSQETTPSPSGRRGRRPSPTSGGSNSNSTGSQLYSSAGRRISSPAYGQTGGGGVGVGDNSPFGSQFGAYATLLRDQVARNWKTGDLSPRLRTAPARGGDFYDPAERIGDQCESGRSPAAFRRWITRRACGLRCRAVCPVAARLSTQLRGRGTDIRIEAIGK